MSPQRRRRTILPGAILIRCYRASIRRHSASPPICWSGTESDMTLDQCEDVFDAIRSATSEDVITAALRMLLDEHILIEMELHRGTTFWRGQKCDDENGYANRSRLSYPPALTARKGRLNDEGASCHYSAQQINTVLAELDARKGEYFHIVGIKICRDEAIRVITIGDLFHVHKTGHTRTLGLDPDNSFSKLLNSYPLEKGQTVVYIDAFLAGLLADREAKATDYLISRRLAVLAFQRSEALGMFYPSVPDQLGMNFAMLPPGYDSKTQIVCSQVIRIKTRRRFCFYEYEVCREATGISPGGDFAWRKPESQKRRFCFNLTKEEAAQGKGMKRGSP